MNEIINWCNENNGFLTAVLSVIGLVLSLIAIVVSIKTARLPYKKELKLSATYNVMFQKNNYTNEVSSAIIGMDVNVANTGSREINITRLNIGMKHPSIGKGMQCVIKLSNASEGIGILHPTQIATARYNASELMPTFARINKYTKLYVYAVDSEGKEYKKKIGTVNKAIDMLNS